MYVQNIFFTIFVYSLFADIFNLKETDFPEEVYRINMFTVQGVDLQSTPIMWYWAKKFYKNEAMKPIFELYTSFMIHQHDLKKGANNPGILVIDATGSGLSNIDLKYSFFMVELMQDHYPLCYRRIINVNLPFILNATSKIIMSMMGEQLRNSVDFIKHQKLVEYISKDNIPSHLDGSMVVNSGKAPQGCVTLKEKGMDADTIAKIYSTYKL